MAETVRRLAITERARRPIARLQNHDEQQQPFSGLLDFDGADR